MQGPGVSWGGSSPTTHKGEGRAVLVMVMGTRSSPVIPRYTHKHVSAWIRIIWILEYMAGHGHGSSAA